MRLRWLGLLSAFALVTACGGDDDQSTGSATTTQAEVVSTTTSTAPACPAAGFEGTLSRVAEDDHVSVDLAGDAITDVAAVALAEGQSYTIYLADRPLEGTIGIDTIEAPAGGIVVTFVFQSDAELEPGTPATGETSVIIDSGGGAIATTSNSTATVTPIAWSADEVCFDVTYQDDFQAIEGVISAPVVASF